MARLVIRQGAIYFAGRLVPGAVSLATIALYTHSMGNEQYGQYAIVLAAVSTLNAVFFQWLSLSLGRLLPAHEAQPKGLLSTAMLFYLCLTAVLGIAGVAAHRQWPDEYAQWFVSLMIFVACAQAWFDLNLKIVNVRLLPVRYGVMVSIRAVLALLAGLVLLAAGFGVRGVLWGLAGSLIVTPFLVGSQWREFLTGRGDRHLLMALVGYGAPLAVTFVLTLVVDVSGRLFLGWYKGPGVAGLYAAAFDLTQQSLGMLMSVVHLAGFPIVVKALESKGLEEAQREVRKNGAFLLAVSVPAAAGLALLAENISGVMLGASFHGDSAVVIAVVAPAMLIGGLRSYYFDYRFHLARKMKGLVWTLATVAITNVVLNVLWIPPYGVVGASFATLAAFAAGILASVYFGKRIFELGRFPKDVHKILLSAAVMAAILFPIRSWTGLIALSTQVLIGTCVYAATMILLDFQQSRATLMSLLSVHGRFPR